MKKLTKMRKREGKAEEKCNENKRAEQKNANQDAYALSEPNFDLWFGRRTRGPGWSCRSETFIKRISRGRGHPICIANLMRQFVFRSPFFALFNPPAHRHTLQPFRLLSFLPLFCLLSSILFFSFLLLTRFSVALPVPLLYHFSTSSSF